MKKHLSIIFVLLFVVAGSIMAGEPSAKFAASYSYGPSLEVAVDIPYSDVDVPEMVNSAAGFTLARIKVPQDKELLVGVSAEIGIVTDTSVKGKLGGAAKAIAGGEAFVRVFAVPVDGIGDSIEAMPEGGVILSKRVQELNATLGGVIQSCSVSCTYDEGTGLVTCGDINIGEDCDVYNEEIGLLLDTTAAHHFNFVLPNLPVGVYDIKAIFTTGARAAVDICDPGDPCYDEDFMDYDYAEAFASSAAKAVIGKTMVTVQQVRATKVGINEVDIEVID